LIFDKEKFTVASAKEWANDHDFKSEDVDETDDSIRLRQRNPDDFKEGSFRTIEVDDGIKAVIGKLKEDKNMDLLEKIAEDIKEVKTSMHDLSTSLAKAIEIGETTLSTLQAGDKGSKPKEEEKPKEDDEKPKEDDEKSLSGQVKSLSEKVTQLGVIIEKIAEQSGML
jgi:hypothetical protein